MIEYSICKKCNSVTYRNTETGYLYRPYVDSWCCRAGKCVPIEWKPMEGDIPTKKKGEE